MGFFSTFFYDKHRDFINEMLEKASLNQLNIEDLSELVEYQNLKNV